MRIVSFNGTIPEPERLILDGQQRLTSLTQVLALDSPVKTFNEKGKPISRYYYIDIDAALEDEQLDEVFVAVEQDRTIKTNFGRDIKLDLSTPQKECEAVLFPLQPNIELRRLGRRSYQDMRRTSFHGLYAIP